VLAVSALLAGCGDKPPPTTTPTTSAAAPGRELPDRTRLAGLAAAAADRKLTAHYILSVNGHTGRNVTVFAAADGSWRVDIQGGALGGTADVSVAQTGEGLFQCGLPSAGRPVAPTCVRVADPGGQIRARHDPGVQRLFTDWVRVLTDRRAPLAVSASKPLSGVQGDCFAVESTSASLTPPLEVGIYCFAADGTLTGARVASGTLVLAGTPTPGPPTVTLPGPVVAGEPLGMKSPSPPAPSATASRSG